jgi:hypothetical protein
MQQQQMQMPQMIAPNQSITDPQAMQQQYMYYQQSLP